MTREDAILSLKGIKNYGRDTFTEQSDWQDSLGMAIKALEQEPKWISVSERLPEITDYYLIQYSRKICNDELAVAYYSVEEKESDPDYEWEFKPICGEYKEVIAWMPLPEPYKAESEA